MSPIECHHGDRKKKVVSKSSSATYLWLQAQCFKPVSHPGHYPIGTLTIIACSWS